MHGRSLGTVSTGRPRTRADARNDAPETEVGSRADRKERTRRRLLDVTLRLITDRSLASLSLREVARDAGIVPTAFYRHFASMDELGVELVDDSMRPLRGLLREGRRGRTANSDIIGDTVRVLARQVHEHPDEFRFLSRERYGGVAGGRRAIATELRLFTGDLTVDLARLTAGLDWTAEDLEMAADLMVTAMLGIVTALLEADPRHPEDTAGIVERAHRQLRLVALGLGAWRSRP